MKPAGSGRRRVPTMNGVRIVICIATASIRTRFADERLPVHADEWDEADYLQQRQAAYLEAFAVHAPGLPVQCLPALSPAPSQGQAPCPMPTDGATCLLRCALSEDSLWIEAAPASASASASVSASASGLTAEHQARVETAVQRVFADAQAWRRSLRPAYFARHRAWRAQVGAPVQH